MALPFNEGTKKSAGLFSAVDQVVNVYLRFGSPEKLLVYRVALSMYSAYDDGHLRLEGVDLRILDFLARILRQCYSIPRRQLTNTKRNNICRHYGITLAEGENGRLTVSKKN